MEQSQTKLNEIRAELTAHLNKPVLLFQIENRKMIPNLMIITAITTAGATAEQNCYDNKGNVRNVIRHTVDVIKIMTGYQKIVYLD